MRKKAKLDKITIKKSETATQGTCDYKDVTKEQLKRSSKRHIKDVRRMMWRIADRLDDAAHMHDYDKIHSLDEFHADFVTGFEKTEWWDNHRKIHRHHLAHEDGVPDDVNLMDVLEYITDCVVAGKARSGEVYDLVILPGLLEEAFANTVALVEDAVIVKGENNEN